MQLHTNTNLQVRGLDAAIAARLPLYPSLDHETRVAVDTACAAWHLGRKPQTLRGWACNEDGPVRCKRIHGRLAWAVADLKNVLGVAA